jgi:hypothetical protein
MVTVVACDADPAFVAVVTCPKLFVAPYSNTYAVGTPPEFTVPDSITDVAVGDEAEPVCAVGGASVVNASSAPYAVPEEFVATSRSS